MKLKAIASSLLLLPTFALAQDAVLNVAGEIQVNGETVINNKGQFVGGETFKKSDYYMLGEYEFYKKSFDTETSTTIIAQKGLWQEESTSVRTDIRSESEGYIPNPNYIPDFWNSNPTQDEIDACYEVQCENEEIWSDKLVDNTYVTTTTDFWKNIEIEGISTTTGNWSRLETKNGEVIYESNDSYNGEATYISLIDNYNDDYVLGTISPSYLHRYEDIRDGRIWFDGDDFSYAVKVKTFTVDDVEFSNCLAESDGDEIVCPNLGLVYSEDYGSLQKHTASMTINSTNGTPIIRSQSRFFEK